MDEITIEKCQKRIREYKRSLDNVELIALALRKSIAIETLNIAELKKKEKEQKNGK